VRLDADNEKKRVTTNGGGLSEPEDEALRAVLGFYRLSRRLRNAELHRNLTLDRLSALSVVARRQPLSISELSIAENVTPPTISRTVAALQEQALVRCIDNRHDGRSVLVLTTPKGRAILRRGIVRTLEQVAELLGRFEANELAAMADVIQQARDRKGAR
jgi:DNA-binding MarR family transcriptional regulator